MRIFRGIDSVKTALNAVVTAGTFDGVHLGHKALLLRLDALAQERGMETLVITYEPHPRLVLYPDAKDLRLITTLDEKIALLESCGVQNLLVIPFTKEFSQTTGDKFIREVLVKNLGTKVLVIGYDHRFGHNREGSFAYLQANADDLGLELVEIPRQEIDDIGISSTQIRKALQKGDLSIAEKLLGRPYTLIGTVIHGLKLGRELGFPTANLQPNDGFKLIPAHGVYTIKALINQVTFHGVASIGNRPVLGGTDLAIEAHLFEFNEDIYGKEVSLEFLEFIRPEWPFSNLEDLKAQIAKDVSRARAFFLK